VEAVEAWSHAARLDELLRELRRQAFRGSELDQRKVLDWLRRHIGADVALISGAGSVEVSSTGFPQEILGSLTPVLARICGGQMAAAVTEAGGLHVRCEALGPQGPRPVLVAVGPSDLTREAASQISHVGSVIAILRRAHEADAVSRGYEQKTRQVRFGVMQALVAGDPELARRMTAGGVPALLDAEALRVQVLHCTPGDRDRIAQTYQDPSGYHGRDLMVHCPAYKEHLVCLIADDADGDGPRGHGRVLRHLVRDNPAYALGISSPHPLHATGEAYSQALHALAVARNTASRIATYHGQAPLARLLNRQEALVWAHNLLAPLRTAPGLTIEITRLALNWPRSRVAIALGISRNTVTTHLKRAGALLGKDLDDVRFRATVDLAASIKGAQPNTAPDHGQPPPTLDTLLRTGPAAAWAETFLRPLLDSHPRDLHTTLSAWIDANTDAQQAARSLGRSRNTVRAHLRAAEHLLSRDLLTTGSGIHDLVHALRITRGIPHPPLAAPATR
jgi:DNA-binding CsgD family transcriptional regulator